MNPKIVISIIAGVLLSSVAVVTLAAVGSDPGPSGAGEETAVALDVTGTPTAAVTPTGVDVTPTEVDVTPTEVDVTPTPGIDEGTPTPTPVATPTEDGSGPRDVTGIPDDNPNFVPDDDGVCERGETREMTTPGGHVVVVPCHVVEQHDQHRDEHPGRGNGPPHSDE